jgi:predicted transcriptional regulator
MEGKSQGVMTALTADIVAAFVSNNSLVPDEVPKLIQEVYRALRAAPLAAAKPAPSVPAVPIRKSVRSDYLVCLEDGQKFKSLKRHIHQVHGLTPEAYRSKWDLPRDYPMVAQVYAEKRSALAKSMGLGRKRQAAAAGAAKQARKHGAKT